MEEFEDISLEISSNEKPSDNHKICEDPPCQLNLPTDKSTWAPAMQPENTVLFQCQSVSTSELHPGPSPKTEDSIPCLKHYSYNLDPGSRTFVSEHSQSSDSDLASNDSSHSLDTYGPSTPESFNQHDIPAPEKSIHLVHSSNHRTLRDSVLDAKIPSHNLDDLPDLSPLPTYGVLSTELPKPPIPYQIGWRFFAHAHTPSAPIPVEFDCLMNTWQGELERNKLSPRQRCQRHPPLPGSTSETTLDLQVQTPLQVKDGYQAQVFTVSLRGILNTNDDNGSDLQLESQFVAKVFDPLYFDDDEGYFDPFLCMDHDYTHEAGVFQALREFQGRHIPRYYGAYSICLSLGDDPDSYRVVRMVLMEYIQGVPMSSLEPSLLSQSIRKQLLYLIVDVESQIYRKDIALQDFGLQNIMVMGWDGPDPQIMFIDFADTLFQRDFDDSIIHVSNRFLGQYVSPLLRWRSLFSIFKEWVDWDWASWLQSEFGDTANTITPEMLAFWSQ